MKNVVFWDVAPCGSCRNRCFGGKYRLYNQGEENQQRSVLRLLVTANVVRSHPDNGGDTFLRNVGSYRTHTT
jgi:hypothetical protein